MDIAEAAQLLSYHSGTSQDIDHPKWKRGFLGMLRPYKGHLVAENYHEVIACIRCLAPVLQNSETLPRGVVSSIWGICHLSRSWGVEPGGMLRSNKLIANEDVERLETWVETISYATMLLIDGADPETAFEFYRPVLQK